MKTLLIVFALSSLMVSAAIQDTLPAQTLPAQSLPAHDTAEVPDNSTSKYLWSSSAYGMKQGQVHYQNVFILYNQLSVGITDNFSVDVAIIPIPPLFGSGGQLMWLISPKFYFPLIEEKLAAGFGFTHGSITNDDVSANYAFGTVTYGSRKTNMSLSMGVANAESDYQPVVNLSGMATVADRVAFISENYFTGSENSTLSFGIRLLFDNTSFIFGAISSGGGAAPWLSLSIGP